MYPDESADESSDPPTDAGHVAPADVRAAEAARYAVLQRLGPAFKHDLVVNLQAVAMMAEVLGARLDKGLPTQADLQHHVGRIHRVARDAVANSLKVASWLNPPDNDSIGLREGLEEGLDLVRSNFGFRGFSLQADLPQADFEVSHALLRHLLLACLIHLTDQARSPGTLEVSATLEGAAAAVTLRLRPAAGQAMPEAAEPDYRRLGADDLRALAAQAPVDLHLEADCIVIRLPRQVPTSPLQIAPH